MTQSHKFFITINSQVDDVPALFDEQNMEYMAVCMEAAPTTGHLHYHIFVQYYQRRRYTAVQKDFPGANIQTAKGTFTQVLDYMTKQGDLIFEKGTRPSDRRRPASTSTEERFYTMVQETKKGLLNKECLMYARYRSYFDNLEIQHSLGFTWTGELDHKNLWIYGPTGTGKSMMTHRYAMEANLTLFNKLLNKWWDGFYKQNIVLIEDADPQHCRCLAHHFKLWADRYSFTAEVKGGCIVVYPSYNLIVTSNYSIDECFEPADADAIKRRFDVLYWG